MTVGELSRHTGMPIKKLRQYEGMGLIYNQGRSPGGYRLFDQDALWCVEVIRGLRELGLTEAEIKDLGTFHDAHPEQPLGPQIVRVLTKVRARSRDRIEELERRLSRIDGFDSSRLGLESPPGVRI